MSTERSGSMQRKHAVRATLMAVAVAVVSVACQGILDVREGKERPDCDIATSDCPAGQVCSGGVCRSVDTDAGSGGAGGTGGTGGVPGGSGGQGGGTVSPGVVGSRNEPCAGDGALGCEGHASRIQLVCTGGRWALNSGGGCLSTERCDTREPGAGLCEPVVPECANQTAGHSFCRSFERFECGTDLVTAESQETCPNVCLSGTCSGSCRPLAKRCGPGTQTPQTCDATGTWTDGPTCSYLCDDATGDCIDAPCDDGVQNGTETDADCGGSCGATCAVGEVCAEDADCESGSCLAGLCTVCKPNATRCSGTGVGVETCDSDGSWGTSVACSAANGTASCTDGACGMSSCDSGWGDCTAGNDGCETNLNQVSACGTTCGNRVACAPSMPTCDNGACVTPPSCVGLASTCGPSSNESCCASPLVTGGTFYRSYDGVTTDALGQDLTSPAYPATVSDFRLDKYEVTVGRFRKFKAAWDGGWRPTAGAGKHTHLNGGDGLSNSAAAGYEPGWDPTWAPSVAPTDSDLITCGGTWTSSAGANENRPISCANWYEHYAFCIWDGGFLPSEAESNYAAAGGAEQRVYPWSSPPTSTSLDCTYANYYGAPGPTYCSGTYWDDVGFHSPNGDGKYGQADLAGNVWEWTLGWHAPYVVECTNCSNLPGGSPNSVIRGGGYIATPTLVLVGFRADPTDGASRNNTLGARCARTP